MSITQSKYYHWTFWSIINEYSILIIASLIKKLLSVGCGSINPCDAFSMSLDVHDDASDFTISSRQPENKHNP